MQIQAHKELNNTEINTGATELARDPSVMVTTSNLESRAFFYLQRNLKVYGAVFMLAARSSQLKT